MFHTEQDETSGKKNLNETKISNLPDEECKAMISREEWMYIQRTSTDRKYKNY